MKSKTSRLLTLLMAVIMIMAFSIFVNADMELGEDYTGKTVILSSNDVHGALDGYAYMKALETEFKARGADVITVDAGDFSQGTTYVSESKGESAISMMNLAGYDYSTLGNHEFDYGPDIVFRNVGLAEFKVLCADIFNKADNASTFAPSDIYVDEASGLKIGFFGMATPETQTKSLPTNFADIQFPSEEELYPIAQKTVDQLKADGADVIVCLAHLGVDAESEPYRSVDMMAKVNGIDIIIDGHSHTVMTAGEGGETIMSTGTKFMNVGVTVIDEGTKSIVSHDLYHLRDDDGAAYTDKLTPDPEVMAAAVKIMDDVDAAYGAKIAESKVELNGARSLTDGVYGNRDGETNNGDLITDAIKWYIMKDGADLGVPAENVVTITNGGGIRAAIKVGDVSKKDILTVLPFGNTIAAVTVKGSELLEALEASTYGTPNSAVGGFPQIEGMEITISGFKAYDANPETYPESTYYGPASINRVKIKSVNGNAFDPNADYVVLTNNFCAAGGDTYYAFVNATSQFDTGITMDYAVTAYVIEHLDGVIDETYAKPRGRITIYTSAEDELDATTEELAAAEDKTASVTKLAVDMVTAAASGVTADEYTADSYNAYMAAFEAATAVLNKKNATKADIDAADEALSKANAALAKKADQTLKITKKTKTLKVKSLKKSKKSVTPLKVTGAKTALKYSKVSGKKNFTVSSKTGKVTVKKGTKKGTYTVKIKVTAPADDNNKAAVKTVSVKIKVK